MSCGGVSRRERLKALPDPRISRVHALSVCRRRELLILPSFPLHFPISRFPNPNPYPKSLCQSQEKEPPPPLVTPIPSLARICFFFSPSFLHIPPTTTPQRHHRTHHNTQTANRTASRSRLSKLQVVGSFAALRHQRQRATYHVPRYRRPSLLLQAPRSTGRGVRKLPAAAQATPRTCCLGGSHDCQLWPWDSTMSFMIAIEMCKGAYKRVVCAPCSRQYANTHSQVLSHTVASCD